MYLRTAQQMIDQARSVADAEDDDHVTDTEALDELNRWLARLWLEVAAVDPDRWLVITTVSTTSGTTTYELPTDFLSLRRLDRVEGSTRVPIEPSPLQEVDRSTTGTFVDVRYRVMSQGADGDDGRLYLLPDPGTYTYELLYVQCPQRLADVSDSYDGVAGWERYAVLGLARHFRRKADRDESSIVAEQAEELRLIQAMAAKRDAGRARKTADVRSRVDWRGRLPGPP